MFSSLKKFANDFVAKVDDKIQKLEVADPMLKSKKDRDLKKRQLQLSQSQKENLTLKSARGAPMNKSTSRFERVGDEGEGLGN